MWADSRETVESLVYGPHLEDLARLWCARHAADATLGGVATVVRPAVVACAEHRATHEIDLVVQDARAGRRDRIVAIGDVKARERPAGVDALERLDHLRARLPAAHVTTPPRLILVSAGGFSQALQRDARQRGDVELVDLERLYAGT